MQEFSALDGALLVDKPTGPTSHDVVDAIRRRFGIKKVGHCGTLDPNATGLLIIVLGRGTKLSEKLMSDDKVYEGAIKFGETTNSVKSIWPKIRRAAARNWWARIEIRLPTPTLPPAGGLLTTSLNPPKQGSTWPRHLNRCTPSGNCARRRSMD